MSGPDRENVIIAGLETCGDCDIVTGRGHSSAPCRDALPDVQGPWGGFRRVYGPAFWGRTGGMAFFRMTMGC